jgi:mono/diheme cytochrome c family protein
MLRKILLGLGALLGLVVLGVAGLLGYSIHAVGKTYDVPLPNIKRATTPEALARGEQIFRTACAECHAGAGSTRPTGVLLVQLPPVLGKIYSANLTSHPEGGVGAWTDEELARMITQAIDREGKVRPMGAFKYMGDEDVAAVIGYMRSNSPDFEPVAQKAPRSELSLVGNVVQVLVFGIHDQPRAPVAVPAKNTSVEYGRYMANAVYDCYFCHTAGMSGNKLNEPGLYSGGFEFDLSIMGQPGFMYSPNITPHETAGIGKWSAKDFTRAIRDGVNPEGYVVRLPMPKYRYVDDVEAEAMFNYFKTVPPSDKPSRPSTEPRVKATPNEDPEKLFTSLGCEVCHGEGRPYAGHLKNVQGQTPEQVAEWIRNPQRFKPATQMPSYESLLDERQAVELARWVQKKTGGQ